VTATTLAWSRFVILEHDHPFLHWDLMLEEGDSLRTWRLLEQPRPGVTIAATALGAHRLRYLDYEGPVSGNRGRVTRWDSGTYAPLATTSQRLVVALRGVKLRGQAVLQAVQTDEWNFRLKAHAPAD
jgi:hypothetical protein